jgi:hypothetical protein
VWCPEIKANSPIQLVSRICSISLHRRSSLGPSARSHWCQSRASLHSNMTTVTPRPIPLWHGDASPDLLFQEKMVCALPCLFGQRPSERGQCTPRETLSLVAPVISAANWGRTSWREEVQVLSQDGMFCAKFNGGCVSVRPISIQRHRSRWCSWSTLLTGVHDTFSGREEDFRIWLFNGN